MRRIHLLVVSLILAFVTLALFQTIPVLSATPDGDGGPNHGQAPSTLLIELSRVTEAPTLTNQSPVPVAWETLVSDGEGVSVTTNLWYRFNQGIWTPAAAMSSTALSGTFMFSPSGDGYYAFTTVAYTETSFMPPVVATGDVTTTYDTLAPTVLLTVPRRISSTHIPVAWHIYDTLAGVVSYTVQYNVDGGVWMPWIVPVTGSMVITQIQATTDTQYGFRAQAMDNAGNLQPWVERTTYVGPIKLFLPLTLRDFADIPLENGDFESGELLPWNSTQDALPVTLLENSALARSGDWSVLIGDVAATGQGDVPVGNGRLWQLFTVPNLAYTPVITIHYHFYSQDIVRSETTNNYLDSFEIYLNTFASNANNPPQDDLTRQQRCIDALGIPDPNPSDGLVFCEGREDESVNNDFGWRAVQLDLSNYEGELITLYLASFSRQDKWFNTYVYLDDIETNW